MDYEKKYKEALVNMQELYNSMKYMSSTDALHTTTALERVFPELKENEDEKIRKELLESFKYQQRESRTDKEWLNGIKLSEVVAWLEKQGEQKPLVIDEGKAEMDYCFTKMMNGEKVSSVWSEEDEENLNQLHKLIVKKAYEEYEIDTEDETLWGKHAILDNWLNSFKDRVKSQWKPGSQHIAALEYQVNSTCKGSWQYKASKELLEQLKKL